MNPLGGLTLIGPGGVVSWARPYVRCGAEAGPRRYSAICDSGVRTGRFIAKFAPEMQCRIGGRRAKLEARFPDAVQMVYDNYNFLVIGFGPTRRASDAILSLAAHARGVNLCFLQRGPELPDPTSILRGSGRVVRTVALDSPDDLDRPDVGALIEVALGLATTPMDASDNEDLVIKSVSAKQRPRR
jgi:hypothetical protein